MNVLRALLDAGLTIESDGELLVVSPAGHITPDIRTLIRENKPSLLAYVRQVEQGSATLIAAINRCCNARGDDPKNRAELIDECGRLLARGQAEMQEHFEQQAAIWEKANRGIAP